MQAETPRLLRLPQVLALTGLSRDTVYRLGRAGRFPQLLKVSKRASRWREDEIRVWLEQRSAERTQAMT